MLCLTSTSPPRRFTLMRKHCSPTYACFQFFDGNTLPRVVASPAVPSGPVCMFNTSTVFFLGLLDQDQIHEFIRAQPLKVEVHDRDTLEDPSADQERQQRWEAMLDGTYVDPRVAAEAAAAEEEEEDEEDAADIAAAAQAAARRSSTRKSVATSQAEEEVQTRTR